MEEEEEEEGPNVRPPGKKDAPFLSLSTVRLGLLLLLPHLILSFIFLYFLADAAQSL